MVGFADRLVGRIREVRNAVMVGIDPRLQLLPGGLVGGGLADRSAIGGALEVFVRGVIDVVAPLVPVVKFQAAFYELHGAAGIAALQAGASAARERGLLVVIDGKRNDISSTAEAYARAYLGRARAGGREEDGAWDADALTINPYLGSDGITPFLEVAAAAGNGVFVLVRTSNPSAREFQDLIAEGRPLYRHVAERLVSWAGPYKGSSGYSLAGAVVGATYPEELAELRSCMPGIVFLVPGYGSQGGTAADVAAAFDEDGLGAVVNNSRGLVFAYQQPRYRDRFGTDWQRAIEQATLDMIEDLAANTPAGRLRA
jgi:orotidine-5'-phosphate decarboxylase